MPCLQAYCLTVVRSHKDTKTLTHRQTDRQTNQSTSVRQLLDYDATTAG